jgi:hypothetical protein
VAAAFGEGEGREYRPRVQNGAEDQIHGKRKGRNKRAAEGGRKDLILGVFG